MAGLKNSFSKGLATINVKTSNFMEENKLRTHIATLEAESEKLKRDVGETVYGSWNDGTFTLEVIGMELEAIKEKYGLIETLKGQIGELWKKEKQILGSGSEENEGSAGRQFCTNCGAEYKPGYKFCEKCGNRLE